MKVFTTINPDTISNIYLVTDDKQENAVIIDPGSFVTNVYKMAQFTGAEIKKIIVTHNDMNQIGGIPLIKRIYDAEIFAHDENIFNFKATKIKNGSVITIGDLSFKIIETPVHTHDSISILIENALFVGDIFQAGTLNSFYDKNDPSDYEYDIIRKHILPLSDEVIIYPGRGPATTIEIERKYNPFFQRVLTKV